MDEVEFDEHVRDDLLRLIFMACHPALPTESRVALTLRVLGGLATDEIARAFVVPEATIAPRIVRAKSTLAGAVFEFRRRPSSVRAAVVGAGGRVPDLQRGLHRHRRDEWTRPELTHEALRLGRVLAGLAPHEPEVHGLVALMEIQASRPPARSTGRQPGPAAGAEPRPVGPLADPARLRRPAAARWPASAARARTCCRPRSPPATPGRGGRPTPTGWRSPRCTDCCARLTPTPIVELNRAVAVAMADGPAAALPIVDALADDPALRGYHLLPTSTEGVGQPDAAAHVGERPTARHN